MADKREYKSASQERGYRVLLLLSGNEFNGLAPGELAKSLETNPGNITRDLRVLRAVGLAEETPGTGRWRLGPKLIQIANAFKTHMAEVARRAEEIDQRYTRDPR